MFALKRTGSFFMLYIQIIERSLVIAISVIRNFYIKYGICKYQIDILELCKFSNFG